METMGDRLRQARLDAGHSSARAFAAKQGWPTSTYAAHENGQNEFDAAVAAKYGKVLKVSAGWLLTGDEPRALNGKRPPVVESYDPDAPEKPLDPDAPPDPSTFPSDAIKELASKGGMGAGQTIATTYVRDGEEFVQRDAILDEYWRIPPPFVRSILNTSVSNLLIVECQGDSMRPTLEPRDRVVVDLARTRISADGLYAIRGPQEDVIIKRLEIIIGNASRIRVVSDNPKHAPQECGLDEIKMVGKVVLGLKLF